MIITMSMLLAPNTSIAYNVDVDWGTARAKHLDPGIGGGSDEDTDNGDNNTNPVEVFMKWFTDTLIKIINATVQP